MTWQHLAILLLVVAARDLTTPEGAAAAATAARETRPTPLHAPGNGSRASGGTMVHVASNTQRDHQRSHLTPQQQQQQQQEPASTQERPRSRQIPGGGAGGQGSSVDTVLAALVDYSKDPKLWHFVHSVVDELDYSQRASHLPAPSTQRHPRPALHLSHPNTRYWTATEGKFDTGQSRNHSHRWGSGSVSNSSRNVQGDRKTTTVRTAATISTTPTTAMPHLPWLQQPPEEPFVSAERTRDYNTSSDMLSVISSERVNFVKSLPSPSPHFLFRRVFLDKTFDSHTRQPYRRPVLALTAVETDAGKSEKVNLTSSANHTDQSGHSDGTKELVDKFDSLSVNSAVPERSGESNKRKETSQDGDEEYGGGANGSQDALTNTYHHHHHHHHHHHRLRTFRSQLKFLQRWEERLWRQAHLQHPHMTEGL